MEDIERIKERLENIEGVEPLISSLRTIAAGGWRLALRHQQASELYVEHLSQVLASLLAQISRSRLTHPAIRRASQAFRSALVLVIASERGLCGAYNDTVTEGAEKLVAQQQLQSEQVLLATLGAQATSHFQRAGRELYASYAMPVTRVPSSELVREIAESLLAPFYEGQVDAIWVIHAPYRSGVTIAPVLQRWVPVEPSMLPGRSTQWPPPILETKAEGLFERTMDEWLYSRFYQFVMAASASEQSARYRAMENASSNIERMIGELTLSYHTARQHAITMEMLDLVAASGMLRGPEERHA
jgi:F-type H+-transporting ATPase subunit gamma